MSEQRAVWNVFALVLTLGLAAAVAIVAVTKTENTNVATESSRSPSPSPSASASLAAPGGAIEGEGPFVLYANRGRVFAYDITSASTVLLGPVDGSANVMGSRQPGNGRLVAFTTTGGGVWTVARSGMKQLGEIERAGDEDLAGAVISPDDRRLAVAALGPKPATMIVDLNTGQTTRIARRRGSQYPREPLLPIAWSLGGDVLYHIPYCQCGDVIPGLYALDTASKSSALVSGTRETALLRSVVSASGQTLFYGAATERRSCGDEPSPCEGPPFFLRRLASGQRGAETIRRASDAFFFPDVLAGDGSVMLVRRVKSLRDDTWRVERYNAEGDRLPAIAGMPSDVVPVALLDDSLVVATTSSSIVVVRSGKAETIVRSEPQGDDSPEFLGWLR